MPSWYIDSSPAAHAYALCRANKGAAGVNGQRFEDIEAYGRERWLGELALGRREVVDADLSDYFGSLPHPEPMRSVARRVVDRRVLHLLKMWLEAPVQETEAGGRQRISTDSRDQRRGVPQGSPISPLLANLYMRRFVLAWQQRGWDDRFGKVVTYADDLVICCLPGRADGALVALRQLMAALKLTVNEDKTHVRRLPGETFDFLGNTFGQQYWIRTGRPYLGLRPSRKSIRRAVTAVRELTARRMLLLDAATVVERLNRTLTGWANYFSIGSVDKAYRALDHYTTERLRRWLCGKHKVRGRGTARYPDNYLYERLGLVRLPQRPCNRPWATA